MFVSRLAASGLLLLALLAVSLDGKPVQQWSHKGWPPRPQIPPLVVQQWSQKPWPPGHHIPPVVVQEWPPGHHIPPLVVQQWSQKKWPPGHHIPPLVVQKWDPPPISPPLLKPHESPAGGTTALREELSLGPEAALDTPPAGPDVGPRGSKAPAAPHRLPKSKGASATSAASRPMRDLRTDGKQARQNWGRMMNPDHHAVGGGGGGGGARRLKGLAKKRVGDGCFGLKLDRIGSMSGLGC
uniref:Bradykinin-potentiating and C-type natriuretic peptides n=1 Tax=Lachesis muta muta TaxID=8753 RepID=BNP_LACMU|nr:RecName: Full=Bradykinin-potentiating and C-type natriuretic peptides; AltName: Full=BPP-CNP; Contains: RecName: Full=Bradykinin-potentiating peptide 1; Short=BPP 1; Contains: RecName: Full=Bradykinin-potentiating peptide 2; Short=BPP 2; Contains: RecName: Full=Bradykinin-potentiating peptide 3; Short=BPP 3; Contains: RecName: Full=Bradykinin-potentiating peptide 4; Short=BPP 4; Contains: RecName: Full=Bradykinin-potentiating peptide 5; Short=BPP 5; Contains: RecName: Full=Bradykinin inhibitor p